MDTQHSIMRKRNKRRFPSQRWRRLCPNDPVSDEGARAGQGETRFRTLHPWAVSPTRICCSEKPPSGYRHTSVTRTT